jgi:hypothetical protein
MTSMPLRIDGALIKEARASGEIFHRSIAQQLEHWATLGRALEAVLTLSSVEKLKKAKDSVSVDDLLAKANSSVGKKRTLALLAKKKGPLYGSKPGQPEILLQYRADGSKIAGQLVKGVFVAAKKTAKAKAAPTR